MIKRLFRTPLVQGTLAWTFAAYLRSTLASMRWKQDDLASAEAVWDAGGGVLVLFWHGRIALSPACWPLGRAQEPRALISLSPDGQFIAGAVSKLGFPAIRGSSSKRGDQTRAKGGAGAFRDVLRWVAKGGGVAITPDGPRGPAEEMGHGVPLLAKASGARVLLVGLACRPCLRLASWDRAIVPLPFSRGAICWSEVDGAPRDAAPEDLERLTANWQAELRRLTRRAETILE